MKDPGRRQSGWPELWPVPQWHVDTLHIFNSSHHSDDYTTVGYLAYGLEMFVQQVQQLFKCSRIIMLCKWGLLLWSQMFDFIITMCNCVKFLSVNVGFMSISKPNSAQGKANTFIRKYSWLWLGLHCTRHCWPNCLDRNCLMSGHCIVSSPQGLHTMPAPHVTRGGAELRAFSRIGYKDRPSIELTPSWGGGSPLLDLGADTWTFATHQHQATTPLRTKHKPARRDLINSW